MPHDDGTEPMNKLNGGAVESIAPSLDDAAIDVEIDRLSKLSVLAFERERLDTARKLGLRPVILDKLVRAKQTESEPDRGQGRAIELPEPEPWPHPVDGAVLLEDIAALIRRHVVMPEEAARATALWVVGTYCFDAFVIFPRLVITSPEKQCGKTTLLDVIGGMVLKRLLVSNVTVSPLFRAIEIARPTLLLDEADSFLSENEEMRGIINAGHRRDGTVMRSVGDDFEPRQFAVWSPMAIAAIGKVPSTIEDRAILVRLRRRRPDEPTESFRADRTEAVDRLARMAARWRADHSDALASADPEMPSAIYNRQADNWRPLLAIADAAGDKWPVMARKVAEGMVAAAMGDDASLRVSLLADMRKVFADKGEDKITSSAMVEALTRLEGSPWAEFRNGKELSPNTLAKLLRPFGIGPENIKVGSDKVAKGYKLERLKDDFDRYLGPSPESNRYPLPAAESCGFQANEQPLPGSSGSGLKTPENGGNPPEVAGSGLKPPEPAKKAPQWDAEI
jgi:putative DNA primase/helicase